MEVTKNIKDKNGNEKTVKIQTPKIDLILNAIRERGMFAQITRYQYLDYNMEEEMQIIEAIGKSRTPYFVIDDENRFTYENFIKWAHGDVTMKCIDPISRQIVPGRLNRGIYIAGNTGSGKSWCLEIMHAYCAAWNFKVLWGDDTEPRPLWWRTVRADALCDVWAEKGSIMEYKKQAMLGIQDFGNEPQESLYMGNRLDVVRNLIEYRGDKQDEMTFITSNLRISGDILKERYGDRVASRLSEMCNYFEIKGKDRRIISQK